jgi:16S rRNA G966 N2-methylase RsmD
MRKSTKTLAYAERASQTDALDVLYKAPLPATRTGTLYSAFPYPTKISPDAIALFIAAHTKPGDTIFDGFAGSGTTGLAALLCENPSTELRAKAKSLGLKVRWGARNAVLYELGALGAFVAHTLTNPPNPKIFRKAAEEILSATERSEGWMYAAKDPAGKLGTIRYLIWTDMLRCPSCEHEEKLWDSCVSLKPARISSTFTCPSCGHEAALDEVERLTESTYDDVLDNSRNLRVRSPIRVHGVTGKKTWSRPANLSDLALLKKIAQEPVPDSVPRIAIPWGDLYRSGYHEGITHLHHFYTRRNLIVFARLWERTERYNGALRDALRFWLLSYNASHATIMTRVVAKTGQRDLVITSAQPGVLYVSGLPVEKNLFAGVRRKLTTIAQAFETIHGSKGKVVVRQQSSCKVDLPDGSVDYVFTDPPFGGNIPYAEINFINEAWLDDYTDRKEEIIVSKHQGKSVNEYQSLMANAFKEVHRILKASGKGTVVFHSASADIWNALQTAYKSANLGVERASVLNKTQGSFKQVTTDGAVRGDPVLLLNKNSEQQTEKAHGVWKVAERLQKKAKSAKDPTEQTAQRLYSRLVAHFLTRDQQVPVDADVFYQWLAARRASDVNANVYA